MSLAKAAISKVNRLNTKVFNNNEGMLQRVKYIGHRGLSQIAPENTIPAYEQAGGKMWGAECDICQTLDSVWVLMHDDTVDAMTDGTGTVASLTLAEIKALTVNAGNNIALYPNTKVPTLEEYLLTCKKFKLVPVIEVKTSGDFENLVYLLKKYNFENNCVIISFYIAFLQSIRSYSQNVKMQYVVSGAIIQSDMDTALLLGNCGIDTDTVSKATVELCHDYGIEVNVWTVDTMSTARTYIGYGVDYLTTNKLLEVSSI